MITKFSDSDVLRLRYHYEDVSEILIEYHILPDGSLRETESSRSLLGIKKNGKWGWIDVSENYVIPPLYDNGFVTCFDGIISGISKNGKAGAIFRDNGAVAIRFEHDYLLHIYNQTYHSMDNNGLGGLVKVGDIRLTPNKYGFKKGPYGRYCEYVRWNLFGIKKEGVIDLESGRELS